MIEDRVPVASARLMIEQVMGAENPSSVSHQGCRRSQHLPAQQPFADTVEPRRG
jgi:hypothetical protein